MPREITQKSALRAIATLVKFGRQGFVPEARVGMGKCLGKAIAALNDDRVVVDAAIESLEQWNGHLSVAAIGAIEKGLGKVERDGRTLTIILPESWENV
jgi:hypothetical protein